jgi:hypothetical protein
MPGRWVGGKGSIASPVRDNYIEGEVFTDKGENQGTIAIKVKFRDKTSLFCEQLRQRRASQR